jgi:hypothetical protein
MPWEAMLLQRSFWLVVQGRGLLTPLGRGRETALRAANGRRPLTPRMEGDRACGGGRRQRSPDLPMRYAGWASGTAA